MPIARCNTALQRLVVLSINVFLLSNNMSAAATNEYRVRFPAPLNHYAEVEATFPTEGKTSLEFFLPVWTPGSYLVREYAKNLENLSATDPSGKPLPLAKTRKNRWRVETGGAEQISLHYRIYCREMTVRTNWVDENFALLNGAASFITLRDDMKRSHDVELELPAGWKLSISGMEETSPNHFHAADYDTLVDSPILAGNPVVHEFEVAGKKHFLVNEGEVPFFDGNKAVGDTRKIVEQNLKMWGALPYEKYVFLNLLVDAGGGLEHKSSCTLMVGRYVTRTRKSYLAWLDLVSHEYFHAWNVKRLRPVELGPFDYENEVYTSNLWVAEGFTDYYGALNVRRTALENTAEYLGVTEGEGSLSALLEALQTTPGRLTQPLGKASYDAWIKLYRPDENSVNSTISYYLKGSIVGWLLDARIRHSTNGGKSLDDAMRLAFERYSGEHGYTTPQFIEVCNEIAATDLTSWFDQALNTTTELDYSEALDWFGLQFKKAEPPKSDNRPKAWSGFQTRTANGRFFVSQIPRGTPGAQTFAVDDEILAVDEFRVTPENWANRLEQYAPGNTVEVMVSRRDKILHLRLTLGEEPAHKWQLELNPHATPEQKQHLAAWLGPEPTSSTPIPQPK